MGRPKKWASDAERMAAKRGLSIPVNEQDKRTPSKRTVNEQRTSMWHPEISQDRFKGKGRFSPVDGFVLVSLRSEPNGNTQNAVVSEKTWLDKLDTRCTHGLAGWSCKVCLT